jgi:hypothetical protein
MDLKVPPLSRCSRCLKVSDGFGRSFSREVVSARVLAGEYVTTLCSECVDAVLSKIFEVCVPDEDKS